MLIVFILYFIFGIRGIASLLLQNKNLPPSSIISNYTLPYHIDKQNDDDYDDNNEDNNSYLPSTPSYKSTKKPSLQLYLSSYPSAEPTLEPSSYPSAEPTLEPSSYPSPEPTLEPSSYPSPEPTLEPSSITKNITILNEKIEVINTNTKMIMITLIICSSIFCYCLCIFCVYQIIRRNKKNKENTEVANLL
jgi:hypothetical protein